MVNPLHIIYALAALQRVQACVKTCTPSGGNGTSCSYTCTRACASLSAKDARDGFLGALQSGGNSCSAVGTSGVQCVKDSKFGSCYDHHWSCGRGC
ncbi:kinetochore complex Sim4 subunit Fta4 [Fusarium albosuccineum]|uniref:Kinetochore complex Sim4 subunit Fta4 n=1 Tax=Fusarium albosuccineum TaxID=1237068 RepID=A0A8H4LKA6_9HYPO|nr:kinetochore complex Sim4 subunit Fta4 [Fusarium albosuccineum]